MMKYSYAILVTLLIPAFGQAQFEDVAYMNDYLEECKKKEATHIKVLVAQEGDSFEGHIETVEGDIRAIGFYKDEMLSLKHGEFTYFHPNGRVESKGQYANGKKTGVWERFDPYGNPMAEKVYNPNVLEEIVYTQVSQAPVFEGTEPSLSEYMKKAMMSEGRKLRGKIKAKFVVEMDGSVSSISLVEGIDPGIDNQLMKALENMPTWKAGKKDGREVRTAMDFEMKF